MEIIINRKPEFNYQMRAGSHSQSDLKLQLKRSQSLTNKWKEASS